MKARSRKLTILALLAALVAALVLSACGGGDDSGGTGGDPVSADTPAEDVLDSALGGGGDPIKSGVLDIKLDVKSAGGTAGTINAEIKGPFSSNGDGELPNLDFDVSAGADVGGPTLNFAGGLTLTSDGLWVSYNGDDYQLDDQTFAAVKDSYAKSSQLQDSEQDTGSLSQFGIDPKTWLTDVTNEGTEDVDGTETVHVSGTGDIKQITSDLDEVASKTGQADQVAPGQLDQLENSISNAKVDVYADTSDGALRRLDVTLDIANGGGGGTSTFTLSIGIADPNSDQSVTAPTDAKPLADLLSQLGGVTDSLGGLAPSSTGSTGSTGSTDSGSTSGSSGSADAYYQCVQQAQSPDAVNDCLKFLK